MELGLAVIFGLHSVCSICLTLLNKQLAVEIPFPLTIAGALAKCGFRRLFAASLQGVTGWSNRRGPISMPSEHPLHSEPQLPMIPVKLGWGCLIFSVWFDLYTMFRIDYIDYIFLYGLSYLHAISWPQQESWQQRVVEPIVISGLRTPDSIRLNRFGHRIYLELCWSRCFSFPACCLAKSSRRLDVSGRWGWYWILQTINGLGPHFLSKDQQLTWAEACSCAHGGGRQKFRCLV